MTEPPSTDRQWLRSAIAAHIERASGRISKEDIASAVEAELRRLGPANDTEPPKRAQISELRRAEHVGRSVRIVGRVVELKPPQLDEQVLEDGTTVAMDVTCAQIADLRGRETIWSLDVYGTSMIRELERAFRSGTPREFLVRPVALPVALDKKRPDAGSGRRNYFVYLLQICGLSTQIDILGADDDDHRAVQEAVTDMSIWRETPFAFVRRNVIALLGIVGLSELPAMSDALDAVILQAFSTGRFEDGRSARVQIVLAGPPGAGKGLMDEVGEALQPTHEIVASTNVSVAGLVGSVGRSGPMWTATLGTLPRASHGLCVIPDAQGVKPSMLERISPVLNEAMQDGRVRKSVAGGVEREALTALLVDLNLGKHMNVGGARANEAAVVTLRSLMSRMDVVIELEADYERTWQIARQLYSRPSNGGAEAFALRARRLQLLVAHMRDAIPNVELSPVQHSLEDAHDMLFEQNRKLLERLPEAGDIPNRLTLSFRRIVTANARAHGRAVATEDDVEVALRLLGHSFAFRGLLPTATDSVQHREAWLRSQHGIAPAEEWTERFNVETGAGIDARTMRRTFRKLGVIECPRGRYHLPPGTGAQAAQAEAAE